MSSQNGPGGATQGSYLPSACMNGVSNMVIYYLPAAHESKFFGRIFVFFAKSYLGLSVSHHRYFLISWPLLQLNHDFTSPCRGGLDHDWKRISLQLVTYPNSKAHGKYNTPPIMGGVASITVCRYARLLQTPRHIRDVPLPTYKAYLLCFLLSAVWWLCESPGWDSGRWLMTQMMNKTKQVVSTVLRTLRMHTAFLRKTRRFPLWLQYAGKLGFIVRSHYGLQVWVRV